MLLAGVVSECLSIEGRAMGGSETVQEASWCSASTQLHAVITETGLRGTVNGPPFPVSVSTETIENVLRKHSFSLSQLRPKKVTHPDQTHSVSQHFRVSEHSGMSSVDMINPFQSNPGVPAERNRMRTTSHQPASIIQLCYMFRAVS